MYYIIIRYSNQRFAKQSYLFSSFFSLIFSPDSTILEKREEQKENSEKNKKKRQSSVENCRFFLVRVTGVEPAHRKTLDPKSSASANSATPAFIINKRKKRNDNLLSKIVVSFWWGKVDSNHRSQ